MAGIDSIINTRADAFANNPQGLMQRYAMNQDLLDLLALQKLKQDKEAAQRSLQMQMQAPQNTVKDQLQGQVMDMTRQEVAQAVAPGLQQQGQRMQAEQLQQAMGAGLGGLPAPAGLGMAQGGIVGYAGAEGSEVKATTPFGRWWDRVMAASAESTGDPIADAVLESRRAEAAMSPEERAQQKAISDRYKAIQGRTGLMGLFYPQSDEERQAAVEEREALLNTPAISAAPAQEPAADQRVVPANMGQTQDETAMLTALTSGVTPSQRVTPAAVTSQPATIATTSQSTARAAPTARPAITALTEEGLAAFLNDMTARAQQPAQPSTEQPKYRSRYEDRLAEIEAEKNNRTSALIEFLLAAGASRGTNLGATLTGGGSGLRAREERLRQQETDALKSIIEDEAAQAQRVFNTQQLEETIRANQEKERLDQEQLGVSRAQQRALASYYESQGRAAENPRQTLTDLDDQRNAYVETAVLGGDTRPKAVIENEFYKAYREADINARLAAAGVSSAQQREKMIADAYQKARVAIIGDLGWISGKTPEEIDNEVARRALAQIEFTTRNMGQGTAPPAGTGGSNDLEGWGDLNVTSP